METSDRPNRYFIFYFIMLRILGLGWWHHPEENNMNNFPGKYLHYSVITQAVWVVGFVGLETLDPFIGPQEDVSRYMFSISFVITHDLTLIKLLLFFTKNKSFQEITRTLEIEMYDYYQNYNTNRATKRFTKILTITYWFFGFAAVSNSVISGFVQDHRWKATVKQLNDSMEHPKRLLALPMYVPWDYEDDRLYVLAYFIEILGLLFTGHIILIIDTFIASLIVHMSAQFRTLQEAFETVYERAITELRNGMPEVEISSDALDDVEAAVKSHYTEQQIEHILEKTLKSCIRQHQALIECVEKFSENYKYGFLIQLMSSTGAICVIMVQISVDASSFKSISFATSLAFFVAMIIQLALQCITGSELTWQAGKVAEAAGLCRWERMPPRLRKYLVMAIARAQKPIRFTACGFANIDNECFLAIVKGAYSYYAVLSQKDE